VKSRNGVVNQRKALGFRRCLPIQREFIILKANLMALLDDPISSAAGSSFDDGAVNIGVDK
jgi:hypothetical protein